MKETKTFYYHFDPVNGWLILNAVLLIVMIYASIMCPCLAYWWQMQVLWAVVIFSILAWGWKYLLKHRLAVISDEEITIDSCRPLAWKDIEKAEEKTVRCGLRKCRIISLTPKKDIKYKYNFLQKHNCGFGAFSIPLYNIVNFKDAEEIKKIIAQKVPYAENGKQ